jgi:hypothetical protein
VKLTRRAFLVGGAATTATCAGLGTWRACSYPGAEAFRGLGHFSARAGFILGAVFETMLPPAADRSRETIVGHVRALDAYCDGLAPGDRAQLVQLVYALEHATLPFGGHWSRFSSLPAAARADVLASWQTAGMELRRLGYRSLKAMVFLVYYREPAAWATIDYPGPIRPRGGGDDEQRARYDALLAPAGARPGFGGA